nr:ATP12 family protein [uncultured Erythrobacter sp.]
MKRFYDEVGTREVAGGWQVTLDGRGLKTVKGTPQVVRAEALAAELAKEWSAQGEELDPKSFPLRDAVDYAIDVITPDPASIVDTITKYGDTDTLLYRADPDEHLYARQIEVWEPVVTAFETREGIKLTRVSGIIHRDQDEAAQAALRARLMRLDPLALAGVEVMTNLAASLIVGLSAYETDDPAEALALWRAACLEEEWQADLWGRDYEAEERRAKRQADFLSAHQLTLLARAN